MEEEKPPSVEAPKPPPKRTGLWIGIAVVVVVAIIVGSLAYLGYFNPPPTDTQLRIGSVLTLTGTSGLEVFGPANQRGIQLAIKEINAAGGVLGNPIVYTPEDDTGVPATARDRAQKLVTTDRVDAIIGAVGSGFCAQVLEVTRENQIVQISASCTSPIFTNLTYTEGWFFRTAPSDALQGVVAANYAHGVLGFRTMVVIGNNNPYGRGLANVFATEFESLGGGADATVAIFAEGATSYASDLQTLFTPTLPEAVYMAEYPTDGLKVMRDWAANPAWASVKWVFSEGLLDQAGYVDLLDEQGIDLATIQTFQGSAPGAYLGIVGADYDEFLSRYRAEYGATADPGLFTANAYDAVYLLAAAAQAAGVATPAGIQGQLRPVSTPQTGDTVVKGGQWSTIRTELAAGRGINYEGASGAVNLDQFGDPALAGYSIWGINNLQRIYTVRNYTEAEVAAMLAPPLAVSVVAWSVPWLASPARQEA